MFLLKNSRRGVVVVLGTIYFFPVAWKFGVEVGRGSAYFHLNVVILICSLGITSFALRCHDYRSIWLLILFAACTVLLTSSIWEELWIITYHLFVCADHFLCQYLFLSYLHIYFGRVLWDLLLLFLISLMKSPADSIPIVHDLCYLQIMRGSIQRTDIWLWGVKRSGMRWLRRLVCIPKEYAWMGWCWWREGVTKCMIRQSRARRWRSLIKKLHRNQSEPMRFAFCLYRWYGSLD